MSVKEFKYAEAISERSTPTLHMDLETADGDPVPAGDVTSIEITLRDLTSGGIVNSRDHQQAKNQNGGTVVDGRFSLQLDEGDTLIVGLGNNERRLLTIDAHLSGGRATHEIYFFIRNFRDIS